MLIFLSHSFYDMLTNMIPPSEHILYDLGYTPTTHTLLTFTNSKTAYLLPLPPPLPCSSTFFNYPHGNRLFYFSALSFLMTADYTYKINSISWLTLWYVIWSCLPLFSKFIYVFCLPAPFRPNILVYPLSASPACSCLRVFILLMSGWNALFLRCAVGGSVKGHLSKRVFWFFSITRSYSVLFPPHSSHSLSITSFIFFIALTSLWNDLCYLIVCAPLMSASWRLQWLCLSCSLLKSQCPEYAVRHRGCSLGTSGKMKEASAVCHWPLLSVVLRIQ